MSRFFLIIVFPLLSISCGVKQKHSCQFKMNITSPSPSVTDYLVNYIQTLNQRMGFEAFNITKNAFDATSPILVEKGLKQRTLDECLKSAKTDEQKEECSGFVGLGGHFPRYGKTDFFSLFSQGSVSTDIENRMDLSFDLDFMEENLANDSEKLETATAHEFGHGLGQGHEQNKWSVMYPEVSGKKDYDAHYYNMRNFFVARGCI